MKFNDVDNGVDRTSVHGPYKTVKYLKIKDSLIDGQFPVNPVTKTGISGRGILGKWGPNHAADPIVMRKDSDNNVHIVLINRGDTGEWAIPGGMVELGDTVNATLLKEFMEEATNSLTKSQEENKATETRLKSIFGSATVIYQGYVDDPRNTDNAWIETVAKVVEVKESQLDDFKLEAGDDAKKVKWVKYDEGLELYASHMDFVRKAVKLVLKPGQ
jgi:ADP-ribose pyrophosphatase